MFKGKYENWNLLSHKNKFVNTTYPPTLQVVGCNWHLNLRIKSVNCSIINCNCKIQQHFPGFAIFQSTISSNLWKIANPWNTYMWNMVLATYNILKSWLYCTYDITYNYYYCLPYLGVSCISVACIVCIATGSVYLSTDSKTNIKWYLWLCM